MSVTLSVAGAFYHVLCYHWWWKPRALCSMMVGDEVVPSSWALVSEQTLTLMFAHPCGGPIVPFCVPRMDWPYQLPTRMDVLQRRLLGSVEGLPRNIDRQLPWLELLHQWHENVQKFMGRSQCKLWIEICLRHQWKSGVLFCIATRPPVAQTSFALEPLRDGWDVHNIPGTAWLKILPPEGLTLLVNIHVMNWGNWLVHWRYIWNR